jgi:phytoene synthase
MTPDGPPLDPDRLLALSYVPSARRAAIGALWRLDAALAAVLAAGRDPMISRIKLAWWREALERLDRERAPAEPVLQALAGQVLPLNVCGKELAAMVDGWEVLLSDAPLTPAELETYAGQRGALLFTLSARLLCETGDGAVWDGGRAWALVDLARRVGNEADGRAALAAARLCCGSGRWRSRLRPLGMLAMLARRDSGAEWGRLPVQGSPKRMLRMLGHRVSGY